MITFLSKAWCKTGMESHPARRLRAIIENAASSVVDRAITGVCSLVQIPLVVQFLGKEAFGLWMTLSAVVAAMTVTDFGLSIGMQNRMAHAFGRDKNDEVRQAWRTGAMMLAAIGLVLMTTLLPMCWLVDWATLFHVSDPVVAADAPLSLAIMVFSFCVGLPLTTAHRLALAVQLGWIANLKSSIQAVFTLGLVALAGLWHLNLTAFLLVIALPPALANLWLLFELSKRLGWRGTEAPKFSRTIAKEMAGKNVLFVLPQLGATALAVVPSLLISSHLGAAAVTPWNLMLRVLSLPTQIQQMFLTPLWPAYTEANARGDHSWIRITYKRSIWVSLLVSVLPTLSFIFWGRWALAWWSGQTLDTFDPKLLAMTCIWTAIQSCTFPVAALLNAHGWIQGQSLYGTVAVGASLLVMPAAIGTYGTLGVPLSMAVVFGCIALPLTFWEARWRLQKHEMSPTPC